MDVNLSVSLAICIGAHDIIDHVIPYPVCLSCHLKKGVRTFRSCLYFALGKINLTISMESVYYHNFPPLFFTFLKQKYYYVHCLCKLLGSGMKHFFFECFFFFSLNHFLFSLGKIFYFIRPTCIRNVTLFC